MIWNANGWPIYTIMYMVYSFFVISFGFAIIETMGAQIAGDQYGMSVAKSSWIFTAGGIANVFTFALLLLTRDNTPASTAILPSPTKKRTCKRIKIMDKQMMLGALFISMCGMLVLVDWQAIKPNDPCEQYTCSLNYEDWCEDKLNTTMVPCMNDKENKCIWNQDGAFGPCDHCPPICRSDTHTLSIYQTYIGFMLVNLAFPVGRIGTTALYTKMLDPVREVLGMKKKQGFMLGLLNGGGCVARMVGPLIAEAAYIAAGHKTYAMSLMLAGVFGSATLFLALMYKRLDPAAHKAKMLNQAFDH